MLSIGVNEGLEIGTIVLGVQTLREDKHEGNLNEALSLGELRGEVTYPSYVVFKLILKVRLIVQFLFKSLVSFTHVFHVYPRLQVIWQKEFSGH